MTNLYTRLESCFPAERAKAFAFLPDGAQVTYADVEHGSARFANALSVLGVKAGDRVAVQAEKSMEMVLLYLGCLRCGALFLPLNTAYTPAEVTYFIEDAEPALVVCDPSARDALAAIPAARGKIQTLDENGEGTLADLVRTQPANFATLAREDDDLAAILYSSGTTGRSKGVMLSHDNLASNTMTLREFWRFSAQDVLLHALPIYHTHGLFVAINLVLASGSSMIFLPRFDVEAVLAALPRATVMMGVPTFYIRLLGDDRLTRESVAHMRLFISGSAPLPADIHAAFAKRTGQVILERYGMTETGMNTSNPYDGPRIAGTVGPPLPGIDLRITDPKTGTPLPNGEIGMIEIRGPNVFRGYWHMPEKTASEFRDGWFMSGDLGFIDQAGYVSIAGRDKDLIIAGGFNVYPAEIETDIGELAQVREVAVIGVPHPDLGEAVVAVVVPTDPERADAAQIVDGLADRLARFKQPRRVVFVEELPRNTMGKVQKAALRERFRTLFAAS